jgi:type IV secretory pathway TraG/TraD family ATPase VirD4
MQEIKDYTTQFIRGNQLQKPEEYSYRVRELRAKNKNNPQPHFGGVALPYAATAENFLCVGVPSAGKTTIIDLFMNSVMPGYIGSGKYDHRALIHDHKGESIALMYGMGFTFENGLLKTLNAFDQRGVKWDIAQDINNPTFARQFAEIMIPHNPKATDPFWDNSARSLLIGILTSFIKKYPSKWQLRDVVHVGLFENVDNLIGMLAWDAMNSPQISLLQSSADKMVDSILSVLRTELQKYVDIATFWYHASDSISVADFLSNSYVLLLGSYHLARSAMATINRMFVSRLIDEILSSDVFISDANNPKRTWLILDEAPKIGKLDALPDLLDLGRQMGVSVVFSFHDITQVKEVYGDLAESLLAKFGNKAFLRLGDKLTAEWASNCFGEQEIVEYRVSKSLTEGTNTFYQESHGPWGNKTEGKNHEISVRERKVVMPTEFMNLPRTNPVNGLHGFYITAAGSVKAGIPWDYIAKHRPVPDTRIANRLIHDLASIEFPFL